MFNRSWFYRLCAFVVLVISIITTAQYIRTLSQEPPVIHTTVGEASVFFTSTRSWVIVQDNCVPVRWKVDHIQAVYLNGNGTIGEGSQEVCIEPGQQQPTLTVNFVDGTSRNYTLPVDLIILERLAAWIAIGFVAAAVLAWGRLARIPGIGWINARGRAYFLDPEVALQLRLARWMSLILAGLNLIFLLSLLPVISREGVWPAALYAAIALLLLVASLIPAVQIKLATVFQNRFMLFTPILWFIITSIFLGTGMEHSAKPWLWSAVQTWYATIFIWLGAFWLISYILRRFEFDAERRFAWSTLISLNILICILSIALPFLPFLEWKPGSWVETAMENDGLGVAVAQLNPDSVLYIQYTWGFPFIWQHAENIFHRPTMMVMSSQTCQTFDIFFSGYANGDSTCGSYTLAIFALWATNFAMATASAIIVYELIRAYLSHKIAWMAAVLIPLSPLTIWYVPIAATDYAEMFIAMASLWVLYHLLRKQRPRWDDILVSGLMFGVLIMIKLNPIYLIFGIMVAVLLRNWRALPSLSVIPVGLWVFYTRFVEIFDIPYVALELNSTKWRTVDWLWQEFIYYTPFEMSSSVSIWVGYTAEKTVFVFGFLLILAIFVMLGDVKFPRSLVFLAWLMFLAIAIFKFIFQYSYETHVVGLIPFIYGAAAFGIDKAQCYVSERFVHRPQIARILYLSLWGLLVAHNVFQWLFWNQGVYIRRWLPDLQ